MPHTECAHRQAQTQISNESPPLTPPSVVHVARCFRSTRPPGRFVGWLVLFCGRKQSAAWGAARVPHAEMQPIQTPVSVLGEGFYYTSQSLSTVWSSVSECQQQHVCLCPFFVFARSPCVYHCRSLSSRYLYSKVNPSFFLWPHFS